MSIKDALLDHAETLSRRVGYEAFSFGDLSAEVGIRKASIHHHFPTKSDLARTLIQRYTARFADNLATLDHAATGADRLRGILSVYREALADGQQLCLCVAFSATRNSFDEAVLRILDEFHASMRVWLDRAFTMGRSDGTIAGVADPAAEAAATLAMLEGAHVLARASGTVTPFDHATAALAARLL